MNANWINSGLIDNGLGLSGILTIIFVICKIFEIITWSWWWVLAPMWGSFLLAIVILAILVVVAMIDDDKKNINKRR